MSGGQGTEEVAVGRCLMPDSRGGPGDTAPLCHSGCDSGTHSSREVPGWGDTGGSRAVKQRAHESNVKVGSIGAGGLLEGVPRASEELEVASLGPRE